jgi:hypothetical protein
MLIFCSISLRLPAPPLSGGTSGNAHCRHLDPLAPLRRHATTKADRQKPVRRQGGWRRGNPFFLIWFPVSKACSWWRRRTPAVASVLQLMVAGSGPWPERGDHHQGTGTRPSPHHARPAPPGGGAGTWLPPVLALAAPFRSGQSMPSSSTPRGPRWWRSCRASSTVAEDGAPAVVCVRLNLVVQIFV